MKFLNVDTPYSIYDTWTLQELIISAKPSIVIVEQDDSVISLVSAILMNISLHRCKVLTTKSTALKFQNIESGVTDMQVISSYRRDFPGCTLFIGDEFSSKLAASLSQNLLPHDFVVLPDTKFVRDEMSKFQLSPITSKFQANTLLYFTK